jgi:hypothetical protein
MAAEQGNQSALKHGGAGATKALEKGQPFQGKAAEAEAMVRADLEAEGRAALLERTAIRAQTAMELYWQAVVSAADKGDTEKLDGFISRFGWLVGVSMRAWEQVRKDNPGKDRRNVIDVLKAGKNDQED